MIEATRAEFLGFADIILSRAVRMRNTPAIDSRPSQISAHESGDRLREPITGILIGKYRDPDMVYRGKGKTFDSMMFRAVILQVIVYHDGNAQLLKLQFFTKRFSKGTAKCR